MKSKNPLRYLPLLDMLYFMLDYYRFRKQVHKEFYLLKRDEYGVSWIKKP